MLWPKLLRRNRFGFRLRRRSLTSRLFQVLIVVGATLLFLYLLHIAFTFKSDVLPPDYSWISSRNISIFVKPDDHSTLKIQPPLDEACPAGQKLRLVVAVISEPESFKRRKVIRETWGRELKKRPGVRIFFLVGSNGDPHTNIALSGEHSLQEDIIQQDFIEHPMNLTVKTTFLLKWLLSNECKKAKFILKVNDDVFVNADVLWENLEHSVLYTATKKSMKRYVPNADILNFDSESVDYLIMGHIMMAVPSRDVRSKWYIPMKFYPLNIFPRYLSGNGYLFSSSILPMLYSCALQTPYMNLEDVFITGLCASTQLGLKLTHNPTFRVQKPLVGPDYVCYYKHSSYIHPLEYDEVENMHQKIIEDHNCETFYFSFIQILGHGLQILKNIFRF